MMGMIEAEMMKGCLERFDCCCCCCWLSFHANYQPGLVTRQLSLMMFPIADQIFDEELGPLIGDCSNSLNNVHQVDHIGFIVNKISRENRAWLTLPLVYLDDGDDQGNDWDDEKEARRKRKTITKFVSKECPLSRQQWKGQGFCQGEREKWAKLKEKER